MIHYCCHSLWEITLSNKVYLNPTYTRVGLNNKNKGTQNNARFDTIIGRDS